MGWMKSTLQALTDRAPDDGAAVEAAPSLPTSTQEALGRGGLELSQLGRYGVLAVMLTVCGLLFAWSRIEMVEISTDLGRARAALDGAEAESARLDLELAALTDPTHLSRAAEVNELVSTVPVVDVPADGGAAD
jgi:hypothetical protein